MLLRKTNLTITLASAALVAAACAKSPASPTGSVTVTTPAQLAPANGANIANTSQPITLTVSNAFVTDGAASVLYTFEVSTDASFGSKVQTKTASPGSSQTSVVLDTLAPGQSYFWHARATGGDTSGTFSPAQKFTVGPSIALTAPGPVSPLTGATPSGWPTFLVNNSVKSGPVGAITYRFEVSSSQAFTNTILSQTVPETGTQTSFTPPLSTSVPAGTTLYWRATAIDATNGIVSSPSAVQSFVPSQLTTQQRIALQLNYGSLWKGTQPPGTNGHAVLGTNWDPATITSFNGVTFQSPTLEELQEFDLIDRGMNPGDAVNWMNSNGYPNSGFWDSSSVTVGYPFEYLALIFGEWDLVVRSGG
jgi:hypothetical protein